MQKTSMQYYKEYLNDVRNPESFLRFKRKTTLEEAIRCLNFCRNNESTKTDIGQIKCSSVDQLFSAPQRIYKMAFYQETNEQKMFVGFEADMRYAMAVLCCYADVICRFQAYRKEFEANYLLGRYNEAEEILKEIEEISGLSVWLIQAHSMLHEARIWLERSTMESFEWKNEIKNQANRSCIRALIELVREYCNRAVDNCDIGRRADEIFAEFHVPDEQKELINDYLVTVFTIPSEAKIQKIAERILLFTSVSLVDKYLLIEKIFVLFFQCCEEKGYSFTEAFLKDTKVFATKTNCVVAKNILLKYGKITEWYDNDAMKVAYKLQNAAKKKEGVLEAVVEFIGEGNNVFDAINMAAQFRVQDNKIVPWLELSNLLRMVYFAEEREGKAILTINTIDRLNRIYNWMLFGYDFCSYIMNEMEDTSYSARMARMRASIMRCVKTSEMMEFFGPKSWLVGLDFNKWYLDEVFASQTEYYENTDVDESIKEFVVYQQMDIIQLEENFNVLKELKEPFSQNRRKLCQVVRCLFPKYAEQKMYKEASKLYFQAYRYSPYTVLNVNHSQVNNRLKTVDFNKYGNEYFFADYIFLTDTVYSSRSLFDSDRAWKCYSQVLRFRDVSYPSRLTRPEDIDEFDAWSYFLRNYCKLNMLRRDTENYNSDLERLNECLRVVEILLNEELYIAEGNFKNELLIEKEKIKDMMSNLLVNNVLNVRIDLSQIRVDECDDAILRIFTKMNYIGSDLLNEKYEEYRNGLSLYKQHYAKKLDAIIGKNIRHGFFAEEIRNVLTKNGIEKSENNGFSVYKELHDEVDKLLDYFCYERESKWMQVTHEKSLEAISLYVPEESVKNEYKAYFPFKREEDLKKSYRRLLNQQAEAALENQARKLAEELRKRINRCLSLIEDPNIRKCHDDMDIAIGEIEKWFIPAQIADVEVSLDILVKKMDERYAYIKKIIYDERKLRGYRLKSKDIHCICFVFCNMVINAEEHSKLLDPEAVHLEVSIDVDRNEWIKLVFINYVSPNIDAKKLYQETQALSYQLHTKAPIAYHSEEIRKGTGYLKIKAELTKNYNENHEIVVQFNPEQKRFMAEISFFLQKE